MIRKAISRIPGIRIFIRMQIARAYFGKPLRNLFEWIVSGREESNFYYELSPLNREQVISSVAVMLETDYKTIEKYVLEIEMNKNFYSDMNSYLSETSKRSPKTVYFGRRIAWYAVCRHIKPMVVVETGVAQGLGACVISCALIENKKEGFPGEYVGTDIDKSAGELFKGVYAQQGKILYGDSLESLTQLNKIIDLFINDSDHDSNYEYKEYLTVHSKLSDKAIILGDNSHASGSLLRYSRENNRKFVFVPEKPLNHWYPGAGVGISTK
jgi:hypothetical protein